MENLSRVHLCMALKTELSPCSTYINDRILKN